MSTEQNQFAQHMQGVPSYRYIPILEKIVFDEKIKEQIGSCNDIFFRYDCLLLNKCVIARPTPEALFI